jgi:hypothetical protein
MTLIDDDVVVFEDDWYAWRDHVDLSIADKRCAKFLPLHPHRIWLGRLARASPLFSDLLNVSGSIINWLTRR